MHYMEVRTLTKAEILADVINSAREKKNYSLRQLGAMTGINFSAISRLEGGAVKAPSPLNLKKLAEVLDLKFEDLLEYAGYIGPDESDARSILANNANFLSEKDRDFIVNSLYKEWEDSATNNLKKMATSKSDIKNLIFSSIPKIVKNIKIPILGEVVAGVPLEAIECIDGYVDISEEMARQGEHFALRVKGDSMEPRMVAGDIVIVRRQSDANTGDIAIALVKGGEATVKKVYKNKSGLTLQAFNPKYQPMFFTIEEIETLPVEILGKVVQIRVDI